MSNNKEFAINASGYSAFLRYKWDEQVTYVRVVWWFNTAAVGNVRGECACSTCAPVGVPTGKQCSSTPPLPLPPLAYTFDCTESTATS